MQGPVSVHAQVREDGGVIVDTHTHVISPDTERFPLQVATHMPNDWVHDSAVGARELLSQLDTADVDAAVLVQARTAYGYDNSYVAHARRVAPERLAATAIVDMSAPDRLAQLRYWFDDGRVSGVRLFNIPPAVDSWIEAPELAGFVREVASWGMRVSACILPPDLAGLGRLLGSAPEVPIALDHCAFVNPADGLAAPEMRALAALARRGNVRLKITTTFLKAATDRGSDPRNVLEQMSETFGAHRLMWGSDFPQYHRESYVEIVDFAKYAASRLSSSERDDFLGGTALKVWPELASTP
jgi:L-fuconolactonase